MRTTTATPTKQTQALRPGDRVRLPGGAIRTVSHITDTGYLNRHNEPIRTVWYLELPDGPSKAGTWGGPGNSAADSSTWELAR